MWDGRIFRKLTNLPKMNKIITAAQLIGYRRLSDRSVSLRFETSEKTPNEIMLIDTMLNTTGYLFYKENNELTDSEIKELEVIKTDDFVKSKSQSKRIYNILFVLFEQDNEGFTDFANYYKNKTEKIIEHLKSKIKTS